jgi:hypothetical protein
MIPSLPVQPLQQLTVAPPLNDHDADRGAEQALTGNWLLGRECLLGQHEVPAHFLDAIRHPRRRNRCLSRQAEPIRRFVIDHHETVWPGER